MNVLYYGKITKLLLSLLLDQYTELIDFFKFRLSDLVGRSAAHRVQCRGERGFKGQDGDPVLHIRKLRFGGQRDDAQIQG